MKLALPILFVSAVAIILATLLWSYFGVSKKESDTTPVATLGLTATSTTYNFSLIEFVAPVSWGEFSSVTNQFLTGRDDYKEQKFAENEIQPRYEQTIPSSVTYESQLTDCDDSCPSSVRVSTNYYSDTIPYLVSCRAECETFDLRAQATLFKSEIPTFVTNGISWVCYSPGPGGGWTVTYKCYTFVNDNLNIVAELNYSLSLDDPKINDRAKAGTLTFEEFSDTTNQLDTFKIAKGEFVEFVKTIKTN